MDFPILKKVFIEASLRPATVGRLAVFDSFFAKSSKIAAAFGGFPSFSVMWHFFTGNRTVSLGMVLFERYDQPY